MHRGRACVDAGVKLTDRCYSNSSRSLRVEWDAVSCCAVKRGYFSHSGWVTSYATLCRRSKVDAIAKFDGVISACPASSRLPVDLGLRGILQLQANGAYLLEQGTLPLHPSSADVAAVAASDSTPFSASHDDEQICIQQSARTEILLLAIGADRGKLNDHQIFLRRQIEVFRATATDIQSHTRAKNKPLVLGQVGIRCRHCRQLAPGRRRKASTYFPSALIGIYQAAHNLSVEHLQGGACPVLPQDIREELMRLGERKPGGASLAGKLHWADAGMRLGLVDTDDGIRFAEDDVVD